MSVTLMAKVEVPVAVGVPVIAPLALSESPAGKAPLARENVYGAVPLEAVTPPLYATPTMPEGSVVVVIVGGTAAATVTLSVALAALFFASVACTTKLVEPATVGVPEMTPVEASVSPAGSDPPRIEKVYGEVPFSASTAALYPAPTMPAGSDSV